MRCNLESHSCQRMWNKRNRRVSLFQNGLSSNRKCVMRNKDRLVELLLKLDDEIDRSEFFSTVVPEASAFALSNSYAFILATCLDRGGRSEIIWTIPYDLRAELGHLDPRVISRMTEEELGSVIRRLPHKPRYVHAAPRTILELSRLISDKYDGLANRLWEGRTAEEFRQELLGISGVGQGIANMAVQLIERVYGDQFANNNRSGLDIKPDVHTRRVLYRLGVIDQVEDDMAIKGARLLYPKCPGKLDASLWYIGHTWCSASSPMCHYCRVSTMCHKIGVR